MRVPVASDGIGNSGFLRQLCGGFVVHPLDVQGRHPSSVQQSYGSGQGCVMTDGLQRLNGFMDFDAGRLASFNEAENHGRGAELQIVRDLAEVRIADNYVKPPILIRGGMGLVPGVDDGAADSGLKAHLSLEEVCPLADLVAGSGTVLSDPHTPGTTNHLPGHEEWCEPPDDVAKGI